MASSTTSSTSTCSTMPARFPVGAIVVWEWLGDNGNWQPYLPKVVDYIEEKSRALKKIKLNAIAKKLRVYSIDLSSMIQIRENTGMRRPVRRVICPGHCQSSTPTVRWEYESSQGLFRLPYNILVSECLEKANQGGLQLIDIATLTGMPSVVDLSTMKEVLVTSGQVRNVRRVSVKGQYPLAASCPSYMLPQTTFHPDLWSSNASSMSNLNVLPKPMAFSSSSTSTKSCTNIVSGSGQPIACSSDSASKEETCQAGIKQRLRKRPTSGSSANQTQISKRHACKQAANGLGFAPDESAHGNCALKVDAIGSSEAVLPLSAPETLPTATSVVIPASSKRKHSRPKISHKMLKKYTEVVSPPEDMNCCICQESLTAQSGFADGVDGQFEVVQLSKCSHVFHRLCLEAMFSSTHKGECLQCPTCQTIYGQQEGSCPPGRMDWDRLDCLLPGNEGCGGTIRIAYSIRRGTQGNEHPCPGKPFTSRNFPRYAFLPDTDKGRKVLKLLMIAFQRRLMFTIGTSATTGEQNTVTWNDIHHKTEYGSNNSGHGYPDPNYLNNVIQELAQTGVTEQDL